MICRYCKKEMPDPPVQIALISASMMPGNCVGYSVEFVSVAGALLRESNLLRSQSAMEEFCRAYAHDVGVSLHIHQPVDFKKPIQEMTDREVSLELLDLQKRFKDPEFDALEAGLILKAAVLGWTGDPLKQPPRSVLAVARHVLEQGK